jgi:multiple sugar transport system ATP-binding protein
MNVVEAKLVREDGALAADVGNQRLQLDSALEERSALAGYVGTSVALGFRSESLEDSTLVGGVPEHRRLAGVLTLREEMGSDVFAHVRVEAAPVLTEELRDVLAEVGAERETERTTTVVARLNPRTRVREGDWVELAVDPDGLHFFDLATGNAIYDEAA